MILDSENLDLQEFFKTFNKRFESFCQNLPILLSYRVVQPLHVEMLFENIEHIHNFNFNISPEDNIGEILKEIRKYFPVIIKEEIKKTEVDQYEVIRYVRKEGMSFKEAYEKASQSVQRERFRIERVIVMKDNFLIKNLDTDENPVWYKYQGSCIGFLKKIRERNMPIEALGNMFFERAVQI
jgi:hypothetical protein